MMRALVVLISLAGCATAPAVVAADAGGRRAACCAQCTSASQRDPAGMDISVKDCRSYAGAEFNSGPGVDEDCVAYFTATPTTLGACSQVTK
jgi:hypothetical protein